MRHLGNSVLNFDVVEALRVGLEGDYATSFALRLVPSYFTVATPLVISARCWQGSLEGDQAKGLGLRGS